MADFVCMCMVVGVITTKVSGQLAYNSAHTDPFDVQSLSAYGKLISTIVAC
jgi:hypothetical protein